MFLRIPKPLHNRLIHLVPLTCGSCVRVSHCVVYVRPGLPVVVHLAQNDIDTGEKGYDVSGLSCRGARHCHRGRPVGLLRRTTNLGTESKPAGKSTNARRNQAAPRKNDTRVPTTTGAPAFRESQTRGTSCSESIALPSSCLPPLSSMSASSFLSVRRGDAPRNAPRT